jgi:uncharacterized protein YbcC (UPF0753/DUF2309 family)
MLAESQRPARRTGAAGAGEYFAAGVPTTAPESGPGAADAAARERLLHALDHAAHLLPAQGPITVFIHHNTLHAFEDLPFEEAVVRGSALFGCEPFLAEARYREELARGRFGLAELERVVDDELCDRGAHRVASLVSRRALRLTLLAHGVPDARGDALAWLLEEAGALERLRADVPPEARERFLAANVAEAPLLKALWARCVALAERAPRPAPPRRALVRHRDAILAAGGPDLDLIVHPLLIRACAAFLDQGIARWSMPAREHGFYRGFLRLYGARGPTLPDAALRSLGRLAAEEDEAELDPYTSIERSLVALGVDAWEPFLTETCLALRGWAGMMRQIELRPDRVPVVAPPATLASFVAVRLLIERAALDHIAREMRHRGSLSELRAWAIARAPEPPRPTPAELAWPLLHVAELFGWTAADLADDAIELFDEIDAFGELERRRCLHLAYELHFRDGAYDAITTHAPAMIEAPAFQAVFCLDERSESIRRHLEEVEPGCETLGTAGFFGVAMYYRGARDAHARPRCPVVIQPEHEVEEIAEDLTELALLRERWRRRVGLLSHGVNVGSLTMVRGTILTVALGALATIPLVLRVLFPRLAGLLRERGRGIMAPNASAFLALDRRGDVEPSLGKYAGFTKVEMAAIVAPLLEDLGIARRLAPVVLVIGHGSSSLNNPHESAYDCGACGGSRGGPNARAFAQMANDPEVRRLVAERAGFVIPGETCFVGAEHNTANDEVVYFDVSKIPERARGAFDAAVRAIDRARERDAHERTRRFDGVPAWLPARLALAHVEGRAEDLAQPRPEYCHSTNALCVVGRRARTRGLFLDRRAFLTSYDPTTDDERGTILERILRAIVPVVVGINLEYYFSRVDPAGYGCSTKLPHNVTALLGVMDGPESDLRTGLHWQTVDMHEPVRLTLIVEAPAERLARVLASNDAMRRLVENRWLFCAVLDPRSAQLSELTRGALIPRAASGRGIPVAPGSMSYYRGHGDHLPFARIEPTRGSSA